MGRFDRWAEFREAHCRRLEQWYDAEGRARLTEEVEQSPQEALLNLRVRLGQCISLLDDGSPRRVALANRIILNTPNGCNDFVPIRAASLLLRGGDRLEPAVAEHLRQICRDHLVNVVERRQGCASIDNFTCQHTFFLCAMSQVLDGYQFEHPYRGIPEVYTRDRLRHMGLNALQSLAWRSEHEDVIDEFNSPTYTTISLSALAQIVELIEDESMRELALRIETRAWRHVLALFHPGLNMSCGPYSRSYRMDILGQISHLRLMMCYLGLSRDKSIPALLEENDPMILHWKHGLAHCWHTPAVECSIPYHIPADAIEHLQRRTGPQRFEAGIAWEPHGYIQQDTKRLIASQGGALPGGTGRIVQVQHEDWCMGHRSFTTHGHSFPIHFHYAAHRPVEDLRHVRTVTAAVVFHGAPTEWEEDPQGRRVESDNFQHMGRVHVEEATERRLCFDARALPELEAVPTDEVSLNSFIPVHFDPQPRAMLNNELFEGKALEQTGREAVCRVEDAGLVYEIIYRFDAPVRVRLWRWANFLRLAAFFYEGERTAWTRDQLQAAHASGELHLLNLEL